MGYFTIGSGTSEEERRRAVRRGVAPEQTWGDVGKDIVAGSKDIVGNLSRTGAWLTRKMAQADRNTGFEDNAKRGEAQAAQIDDVAEKWEAGAQNTIASKTPGGKSMSKAGFYDDQGGEVYTAGDNVSGYITSNLARSAPAIVVSAVPGAAVGRALSVASKTAGIIGAMGVTGAGNAAINTGDVLGTIANEINAMPDDELMKDSSVYARLREDGATEAEAKQQVINIVSDKPAIITGLVSAAMGMFGSEAQLAKAGAGGMIKQGFLRGLLAGARNEGITEGVESTQQSASAQQASVEAGAQDDIDWWKVLEAGLQGVTLGGIMGGPIGAVTNIGKQKAAARAPVTQVAPTGPDTTQAAAVAPAPVPPAPPVTAQPAPPKQKKPKVAPAAPVQAVTPVGPDPGQAAALNTTPPAAPVPPAAVPPAVVPVIRKNAQRTAAPPVPPVVAAPVAPPVTQQVTPQPEVPSAPPVAAPPVVAHDENLSIPPDTLPADYGPPESQPLPPTVDEDPPPPAAAPAKPRVLVDLEAQKRLQAQQAEQTAYLDGRGDYEKNVAPDDFDNPAKHQLWRRKMENELRTAAPSEFAQRYAQLVSKKGKVLTTEQKVGQKMLHAEWIDAQLKPTEEAAPAEVTQVGKEAPTPRQRWERVLRRMGRDIDPALLKPSLDKALQDFDAGKVPVGQIEALEKEVFTTTDIEQGSLGGVGLPEAKAVSVWGESDADPVDGETIEAVDADARVDSVTVREGEDEVETRASKGAVRAKMSEGAASEVRKVTISDEDKARYASLVAAKSKPAVLPKPTVQEAQVEAVARAELDAESRTEAAFEEPVAALKTPVVVEKKAKALAKAKAKKAPAPVNRKDAINEAGRTLLKYRRDAQRIAKEQGADSPAFQAVQADIKKLGDILQKGYGKFAYDKTMKEVEAMLKAEKQPIMAMAADALQDTKTVEDLKEILGSGFGAAVNFNERRAAPVQQSIPLRKVLEGVNQPAVGQALEKVLGETVANVTTPGYKAIAEKLSKLAGNVSVVVVTDADFKGLYTFQTGFEAAGIYDPNSDQIVLPDSLFDKSDEWVAHVLLHEGAHAAYSNALRNDPVFRNNVDTIMGRMAEEYTPAMREALGINYAFTSVDEFLSEALSNPRLQDAMASTSIPPKMAKDMGLIPGLVSTLWHAFVRAARRAALIDQKHVSALEAILHAVGRAEKSAVRGRLTARAMADMNSIFLPEGVVLAQKTDMATREVQAMLMPKLQAAATSASPKRLRRAMFNVMTLHQLAQYASKYFPKDLALKVTDTVERIRKRRMDLVSKASVVTELHKAQMKYKGTETWGAFTNLADDATTFNIHPDVPLAHPKNAHVKKSIKWRQARAAHKGLHAAWSRLPPDLKTLWHDAAKYLTDQQNQLSLMQLETVVETALDRKDAQLSKRIFNGTMTEADRALFKTNTAMRAIAEAVELKKIQGVYFPKMRHGRYVVTGRYKMPGKYKKYAKADSDGNVSYEFDDVPAADAFIKDITDRGLVVVTASALTVDEVTGAKTYSYTDPATGNVVKNPDGSPKQFRFAKGDTGAKSISKVTVQDKFVKFYESVAEAETDRAELTQQGNLELSGVEEKRNVQFTTSKVSSRNMTRALNSMEQGAKWKKMSKGQKDLVHQTIMEMSLNFLASSAPQNRARPRRNVLGASTDITRNIAEYAASSSAAIANLELRPELQEALDAMDKHAEDVRYSDTATALPRTQVLEAIHGNVEYQTGEEPTNINRFTNVLLTLSFLDKLVSPAYHMINSLQPAMVALPVIGGRQGFGRATLELVKAYKVIGAHDVLHTGMKDTKRAFTDYLEGTTDYIADMRKRLAREVDGVELGAMLDYLAERGLVDKDAGMEVSDLVGNASGAERLLHRADHVVRQFGTAVEVVNRTTTAIAAYRLERARGATVQQATVYAQETVANTQGNYSPTNAPKAFRHPLARIVLQFKKFAQLQYFLLAKLTYNTFKGATPQERAQAAKSLTGLLVSHAAMAGALGLPTEPVKLAFMLLGMFLPMPTWEEVEQDITKFAQEFLGDNLGDAVTHGLPRLVGLDLHSRVGLNSLALFGEPRKAETESVQAYLWKTVMGAPTGLVTEKIEGMVHVSNGEFGKAAEKLMPLKVLSDSVKAYRLATEGKVNKRGESTMDPIGIRGAAIQALGFTPATIARKQEGTNAYFAKSNARKEARQALLDAFRAAKPQERAKIRQDILRYNATVPANARITMKTLSNLLKRAKTDEKKGYLKDGVYSGAVNKDLADEYLGD